MNIVLVTENEHKVREFKSLIDTGYTVVSIKDLEPNFKGAEENGTTFLENAIKKVEECTQKPDTLFLADDSGLCIDALNNQPGIFSARYAAGFSNVEDACDTLIDRVRSFKNKSAYFECAIAIKDMYGNIQSVSGTVSGVISDERRGSNGFGYDPIFVPDGYNQTFAELPVDLKNQLSHRYRALTQVNQLIKKLN